MPTWQYFLTKAMDFRRKFEYAMNGNPNYGQEAVDYFFIKIFQKLTRYWQLDWRGCIGHGIKWDTPSSFGLWACPLEASHSGRPSQEDVGIHG